MKRGGKAMFNLDTFMYMKSFQPRK